MSQAVKTAHIIERPTHPTLVAEFASATAADAQIWAISDGREVLHLPGRILVASPGRPYADVVPWIPGLEADAWIDICLAIAD